MSQRGNPAIKVRLEPEILAQLRQKATLHQRGRGGGVAFYLRALVYRDLGLPEPQAWAAMVEGCGESGGHSEQLVTVAGGAETRGHSEPANEDCSSLFLNALYAAYLLRTDNRYQELEKFTDLYWVLTILPQARLHYSLQKFGEDIYRLDAQRGATTSDGATFRIHPGATAARRRSNLITLTSRDGAELTYYGIEFHKMELGTAASTNRELSIVEKSCAPGGCINDFSTIWNQRFQTS